MLKNLTKIFVTLGIAIAIMMTGCCVCDMSICKTLRAHRIDKEGKKFIEIFQFEFFFFDNNKELTVAKFNDNEREITEFKDPHMRLDTLADIIGYSVLQYGYDKFYITGSCISAIKRLLGDSDQCLAMKIASTDCRVSCSAYDIANLGLRAKNPHIGAREFYSQETVWEVIPKLDPHAIVNIHVDKPVKELPLPDVPMVLRDTNQ